MKRLALPGKMSLLPVRPMTESESMGDENGGRGRSAFRRHGPRVLLLALACLLFFFELVQSPTSVLYSKHSDLIWEHVPRRKFLVRSLGETAELPLWCPYEYGGVPFVHDIQVMSFYPAQAPVYLANEAHIGAVMSWLVVAHLLLAGILTYAYAVSEGLHPDAALIAGVGFMFSGKWLMHVLAAGHWVTIGVAWLPLVVLLLATALRRRSVAWATAAGAVFALVVLGTQPQWGFYSGLVLAAMTLPVALDTAKLVEDGDGRRTRLTKALARWLGLGLWVAAVAVALAAIQLLPMAEFTRFSTRPLLRWGSDPLLATVRAFVGFFGPGMTDPRVREQFWEPRGYQPVLWVIMAALAAVLGGRRARRLFLLVLLFVAYAAGGADVLQRGLGLAPFRWHARILVVLGLPLAFLAGASADALFKGRLGDAATRARCRLVGGVVLALAAVAIALDFTMTRRTSAAPLHPYWAALPWLLLGFAMLWRFPRPDAAWWRWGVVGALTLDAVLPLRPCVNVHDEAELYAPSPSVIWLKEHRADLGRTLDADIGNNFTSPLVPIQPFVSDLQAVRGQNSLDLLRTREYLLLVGEFDRPTDAGFRALRVIHKPLLDLLGVRYLLEPLEEAARGGAGPRDAAWRRVLTDPHPTVFDLTSRGLTRGAPYALYENPSVLPRAFVVPAAAPLPVSPEELRTAMTTTDFRERVLLEDFPGGEVATSPRSGSRHAVIRSYTPNQVDIEVEGDAPGWLVLTDVWFPGWKAHIDGREARVHRADYLFRAVPVTAGSHRVVFRFRPRSYELGRAISVTACAVLVLLGGGLALGRRHRGPRGGLGRSSRSGGRPAARGA